MELNPEFGKPGDHIPHTNLRSETTVKRLLREGRYPTVIAHFGEEHYDRAFCFVPAGKSKPPESFSVSLEDAQKIIEIRTKIEQGH